MDVWTLKVISIPLIAIINFITGFVPFFCITRNMRIISRKTQHNSTSTTNTTITVISPTMKRFLTLGNFFSAGVFLATCLIGLYPGVNNKFNKIVANNPTTIRNYPYAGVSVAVGFLLVWLLEILVHMCLHCHRDHHHHDEVSLHDDQSHLRHHHTSHIDDHDHGYDHNHDHDSLPSFTAPLDKNVTKNTNSVMVMSSLKRARAEVEDGGLLNDCADDLIKTGHGPRPVGVDEPHSHVPIAGSVLGSVMLTFALGSHSLIEGLGFGVLDEMGTVVNMLITMIIHESVCAISLGVNIASKKTSMKVAAILIFIFSILIPLGIGLGLLVNVGIHKNLLGDIVTAVLQGVAAGTFIYVVFIEILPNEMSTRKDELLRLFILTLGFITIAAMKATHFDGEGPGATNQTSGSRPMTSSHSH